MDTARQTQTQTAGNQQANDALSVLLQQLMAGGTEEMQRQLAARLGEVNRVTALRARYSPEAAFADAQGLINQTLRRAMEERMPTILRSAEGAGASQSSMRALLTQDAITRASEAAGAQGIAAAQGYGQIGANLSGVLADLTRPDNSGLEAIINTIRLMQEANQQTTTETTGGGGGGGSSGGRPSGSSAIGMPSTDDFFYRQGGILSNAAAQRNTAPMVYGPAMTNDQIANTIIAGLKPSESLSSVPNINNLYSSSFRF